SIHHATSRRLSGNTSGTLHAGYTRASSTSTAVSSPSNRFLQKKGACVLAVVWGFTGRKGREDEFEQLHGADGGGSALSRRSRSFLGSSFLRELADPRRYLLTEYWSEMVIYEKHLRDFGDEMAELQTRRSEMVSETIPLGLFEGLDVPDRFGP